MRKIKNNDDLYKNTFEDRGVPKGITHYRTRTFSTDVLKGVSSRKHIWSMGDRFFKLSYHYYGTYDYWWVIAMYNNTPTEAHLEYGTTIEIPDSPGAIAGGV